MDDATWLTEDAADRRAALAGAASLVTAQAASEPDWLRRADDAYRWLQQRDSLRVASIGIQPGVPRREGESPVTTTFNLADTDQVNFTLTGLDAKGAQVPLPPGFTAAWSLADPDASGATLTVSPDTTTAGVAAGVPDTSLMLTVAVTSPDGSVMNGAEAIVVEATAAATVGIVAGTPSPEPA